MARSTRSVGSVSALKIAACWSSRGTGRKHPHRKSLLGFPQVGPPYLILVEGGRPTTFELGWCPLASTTTIPLKQGRVMVQRIERGRIVDAMMRRVI